jgi:hypothetical protein
MSLLQLPDYEKLRVQKLINDHLRTKKRDKRYDPDKSAICQYCLCQEEDKDHILRCHSSSRIALRIKWIEELNEYLTSSFTPMKTHKGIMHGVTSLLEPQAASQYYYDKVNKSIAYRAQEQIGWRHFIRGMISQEWAFLLWDHFQENNITKLTTDQWATGIIQIHWKNFL